MSAIRLPNVWVEDRSFRALDRPRRCSTRACPLDAVAVSRLGNRRRWWCEIHLHRMGRRIEDGRVEFGVYPGSPAAERGYLEAR